MKKIQLINKKEFVIVDDQDYELVKDFKWYLFSVNGGNNKYARASTKGKNISMHRTILNPNKGELVDHINGNGLDNRRENLRVCNHSENMSNRKQQINNKSGYRGVYWFPAARKWVASIQYKNKYYHIGLYTDKHVAAKDWNKKAVELMGKFARLNEVVG